MTRVFIAVFSIGVLFGITACGQSSDNGDKGADTSTGAIHYGAIPDSILTPDSVETRLGTLEFFDGYPSAETVESLYDNLDFQRGVRVFLDALPIASLYAMREGFREAGMVDGTVGIFEELMDSKTLFLTPNTESIYAATWLDLRDGPVVVESPPNTLGFVDDFFFKYVTDLGNVGPDRGRGGKFLFLPPGYDGEVPDGYYTFESPTYGNWLIWRGFQVDGDPAPAVASMKANTHIYPLADRDKPPEQKFVNVSGQYFNTIHANDFSYFEEVAQVIHEEPTASVDPELLGLLASIGIEKGKPFAPDARMKAILMDAAAVGNATARVTIFASRNPDTLDDRIRRRQSRISERWRASARWPHAVLLLRDGHYAGHVAQNGRCRISVCGCGCSADAPAKDFWSVVLYDNQTRSMLQTDQQFPSLNSQRGVAQNADGSTDIFFGPEAPAGKDTNWIQTVPGKGWTVILRLYGPLESWFDKSWQPGEVELMADVPAVKPSATMPKMATEIPAEITTPDRVETRIGTLEFFLVYDNLDFMRGTEAFLTTMPAASIVAMRQGQLDIGGGRNGVVMITENLMDSQSLYLTANTESVYIGSFLDLSNGWAHGR